MNNATNIGRIAIISTKTGKEVKTCRGPRRYVPVFRMSDGSEVYSIESFSSMLSAATYLAAGL